MIRIVPPDGRSQAILDIFETIKGPVASQPDCCGCSVAFEAAEGGTICYWEQWRSREALEQHLSSWMFKRVLEAMEYAQHAPEVRFFEAREIGGLELIERVRSAEGERDGQPVPKKGECS